MNADHSNPFNNNAPASEFKVPTEDKPGLKEYLHGGPKVDEFEIETDGDTAAR